MVNFLKNDYSRGALQVSSFKGKNYCNGELMSELTEATVRKGNQEIKHFSHQQMKAIIEASAKSKYGLRDSVLIRTAYIHGLRVGEVAMMKLSDFDFQTMRIFIHRSKGSCNGYHRIQDNEFKQLKRLYRKCIDEGFPYMFMSQEGVPISRWQCNNILKEASKNAKVDESHFHMLRHTCGVHMALAGIQTINICDWLGHRNIQNTVIYTRIAASMMNVDLNSNCWAV